MAASPAYMLGVLDVLVKSGAVSREYAAGAADVLTKSAALWRSSGPVQLSADWYNPFDTQAENIQQQWNPYKDRLGGRRLTPEQAREVMDRARTWTYGFGDKASANMGHWWRRFKYFLNGNKSEGWLGKVMSPEESNRLREYEYDKIRLDQMREAEGGVPAELQAALQDAMVGNAKAVYYDQANYMPEEQRKYMYGNNANEAANKFRTNSGTQAMRGGMYEPKYDKESVAVKAKSLSNNPYSHMYGSKDRARLYSRAYTNGFGMN